MPRFDVVGLGIAAWDFVLAAPRWPAADEKVRASDFTVQGGGTVGTALVTASRLGLKAAFAGSLGEDEYGRLILDGLEKDGVDTTLARTTHGARSPLAVCIATAPARNVFSIPPTTPPLEPEQLDLDALLDARLLHLDGSEEAAALALATAARDRGVQVSLDLQRVRPGSEALLALADLAVVSESYAREAWGDCAPLEAVRRLHRPGMTLAAITLGPRGLVASEGGDPFALPAEEVEVVDSTGAGDVFHGALLVSLLEGRPVPSALRFAAHVAALSCRALGGRAGIPGRDEVIDYLD